MKSALLVLSALAAMVSITSCTLTAKAYPVAGPAVQGGKVLDAKFTWAGNGSGTVALTLPDGEVCTGRYATVVGGIMSPEIVAAQGSAVAISSASVSTGDVRGLQTSRAMLMGTRGTIVDFEGYTSGANPTHGFGRAKDNNGNVWKVIW
ncbi:hypothetical protein [Prosthecobacter dejongeii]|uniref:Lipoprotein n=1 Tax=Prosthecobacter dejongeii TaxID=48465 RepID=A0A7W7YI65_9BACT|nr:hypothetical protein [Prosthecobacter dejongeii]MBB5036628.1 hypothetical protein [Prosthecobacter dejongeii]